MNITTLPNRRKGIFKIYQHDWKQRGFYKLWYNKNKNTGGCDKKTQSQTDQSK